MKIFRSLSIAAIFWAVFCASLFAQTPPKLEFEVATVRPSPPLSTLATQAASGKINLGIRVDATQFDMKLMSLANLISEAYKVKAYQIAGPDWLKTQLWEIHAKLPPGSTKEQIPEMLQSLLAQRFKLTFHRESREHPVYALTVAKSGLKMKQAVEEPAAEPKEGGAKEATTPATPEGEMRVNMKQEGKTVTLDVGKAGRMQIIMDENLHMLWEMPKTTMAEFTEILTQFADRQVVDMTELKGPYQVVLELPMQELMNMAKKVMPEYAGVMGGGTPGGAAPSSGLAGVGASDPSGGSIFQAVQQLGLKLDARKVDTDTIVVDDVLKEPSEN